MNWLTANYNCDDYPRRTGGYNNILSVRVVTDVVSEPVTLMEIKNHLKEESTDNDTYLTYLGKVSREQIENENNVSLAPKTLKVKFRNDRGNLDLPFGPVTSITSITELDGTLVDADNYTINDGTIENSFNSEAFVQYVAGYTTIPYAYKQMILERAAFLFENRGDQKKTKTGSWLI